MTLPAPPFHRERAIAELAVLRACVLTKTVLAAVDEISKTDSSPVTIADFAAQALIISAVRSVFPNDGLVGEEDASALRADPALTARVYDLVCSVKRLAGASSELAAIPGPASPEEMIAMIDLGASGQGGRHGRFWVMDPVDGTRAFLRGEQYAVSLALVEDGVERVGVLGCPNLRLTKAGRVEEASVDSTGLGVLLTAVRGQGSTIRHVSSPATLAPARKLDRFPDPARTQDLHVVDCLQSKAYRHDVVADLAARLGAVYPGTEVWSSHVRYAALIIGGGDYQLRVPATDKTRMCLWDHAGAQLIFTELGGKITDLDGKPIDFGAGRDLNQNRGMVAAKEGVHGTVLAALREILGEPALHTNKQ
jgi:3'(2'), 5'-bisphosphate nucleotidase